MRVYEYKCLGCGQWTEMVRADWNQSPYTSWNAEYQCPKCGRRYHTHGGDPASGISSETLGDIMPWRIVRLWPRREVVAEYPAGYSPDPLRGDPIY